jgi:hypothetical protein
VNELASPNFPIGKDQRFGMTPVTKFSRSGKPLLTNQKYRQAQACDLMVFSLGAARAHSETVSMTVKWFGYGETQRQPKIVSLNNSGI